MAEPIVLRDTLAPVPTPESPNALTLALEQDHCSLPVPQLERIARVHPKVIIDGLKLITLGYHVLNGFDRRKDPLRYQQNGRGPADRTPRQLDETTPIAKIILKPGRKRTEPRVAYRLVTKTPTAQQVKGLSRLAGQILRLLDVQGSSTLPVIVARVKSHKRTVSGVLYDLRHRRLIESVNLDKPSTPVPEK